MSARSQALPLAPHLVAERTVATSRADGCVVLVTEESVANLRWANNTLTTNGLATSRTASVIATVDRAAGTSVGMASSRGHLADALPELAEAALAAARAAGPAEDAQPLVRPSSCAPDWADPAPTTSMAALADVVPALADAFGAARASRRELFGYAEHRLRSTFLASSTGLRLRTDESTGHIELTAKSAAGQASAWAGTAADLDAAAVANLCGQLDQRLRWASRKVRLAPGRYDTVLPPPAVADLMNYVYWHLGARDAVDGQTVYSAPGGGTRIGERLAGVPLTLRGDPRAAGLECGPFLVCRSTDASMSVFDNGLPLGPTDWIRDGVLAALVQTRHSAMLTGMPLTPHIDNLILESPGASGDADDLVAGLDRGLLLTTLWYIREVDPSTLLLTGLTRDGVYLVDRGEVVAAVNNFRFNESPVDLLGRVVAAGASEPTRAREWGDAFSHSAMPALRVAGFTMSSVSQAI